MGDTITGKKYAEQALYLAMSNSRPTYIDLRINLKQIIDLNYNKYDDPNMEFENKDIILNPTASDRKKEIIYTYSCSHY